MYVNAYSCNNSFRHIRSPEMYVFGMAFIIVGILAFIGNIFALIVFLQPQMKSATNRILASLCAVGVAFGVIYLPLLTWNIFDNSSLQQCRSVLPRLVIFMSLLGTAMLHICLLVYERCVLLQSLTRHSRFLGCKKIKILISLAWMLPGTGLVCFIGICKSLEYIIEVYHLTPVVMLAVLYILVKIAITNKESKLDLHKERVINDGRITRRTMIDITSQYRHVKIAKKVKVMVLSYFLCMIPLTTSVTLNVFVRRGALHAPRLYEIWHLSAELVTLSIICVANLFVYAFTLQDFQNCLRKHFRINPQQWQCF